MENITPEEIEPIEEQIEEPIEEFELELTTRAEYIHSACEAYNTTAESNPMTKEDTRIVEDIKRKCMKIIAYYVDEMYDELFEE
jgi:hypothetical protein